MKAIKSALIAALVTPVLAASAMSAELSMTQKNSIVNSLGGYKWAEQSKVQAKSQQVSAPSANTAGFKWSKAEQGNFGIPAMDRVAKLESAAGSWGEQAAAEQQGFKWVIRSSAEQQGFKWVIRSSAEQQGFKWVIRSSAEQQGFKWVIRSSAEQQGFKWVIR
jgi:hypothetical protein